MAHLSAIQAFVLGFCSSGYDFAIASSRPHLTMRTLQVAIGFAGNCAPCGLSPQTNGMPVIRKNKHLKDQILVLAPSEGLVSSDTWLRCRKKLMANKTFQGGRKAKNTWLAGKVKCGRCGYALMSVGNPTGVQYLRCSKRADSKSCDGCGTLRTREFERFLYGEMVKKLSEFQTLTAKRETVNPKLTALNMELARVEEEIEKLLNTLTGANAVLLSYANSKIEELDTHRQALTKEIAALSAEIMSPEQIERLSVYLNQWEEIDFEDRRQVADGLISQIRATDEHVSIEWKI